MLLMETQVEMPKKYNNKGKKDTERKYVVYFTVNGNCNLSWQRNVTNLAFA